MIALLLVNTIGILLMITILWWFLFYRKAITSFDGETHIKITVNNGVYDPDVIKVSGGKPISLQFNRIDQSPCSSVVQFKDLDVSAELAIGKTTDVPLNIKAPGEYEFTCQMGMYRGKLIVMDDSNQQ
ncbi:MAG: cupredoxin domain-containing protein [Legionellales bacterium]|nr:cupredoxin domain-containing protein [Legionellales bacterium]